MSKDNWWQEASYTYTSSVLEGSPHSSITWITFRFPNATGINKEGEVVVDWIYKSVNSKTIERNTTAELLQSYIDKGVDNVKTN